MNPPSVLGKMKASGEESGHSCFHSQRSSTIPLGRRTSPRLFSVLPNGRIFPLQAGRRAPTRKLKQSGGFRKSLKGVQERQQIGGVCAVQIPVKSTHLSRFAAMPTDGAINRCRAIVMGQSSGLREDVG